jgi:signal transduction histidine kinase
VPPDRTPEIRIRADKATGRTRLWIEDNGVGIPEKQRERVFRVFERLVDEGVSRPGTGIGLAIVRRGMERLGGRVGVEGRQPHGSAFWLELLSAG